MSSNAIGLCFCVIVLRCFLTIHQADVADNKKQYTNQIKTTIIAKNARSSLQI